MIRGIGQVSKTDEYAANALASLKLAEQVSNAIAKHRLLKLAEAWLDLADRARNRRSEHNSRLPEHPLINTKLGERTTPAPARRAQPRPTADHSHTHTERWAHLLLRDSGNQQRPIALTTLDDPRSSSLAVACSVGRA